MELYEKVFGKYLDNAAKQGENLVIPCLWHSDHNPSLSISTNPEKPVYKCWSCGKKGSLIGAYMELNNVDYKTALKELDMFDENHKSLPKYQHPHPEQLVPKEKKERVEVDYNDYCYKVWNDTIMHDKFYEFYGKKLYELRGITYDTAVVCMIGYDKDKGWIFPIIRYGDNKTVGYEVRQKEFKKFSNGSKCFKADHTPSCLSVVWQGFEDKKAIVCEGFIDSIFMYQYLHEKTQREEKCEWAKVKETILTPSNGVKTVVELVKENELWNKFKEVLFVLDNDEASRPITEELKKLTREHGDNFKFFTGLKDGGDFEDWYKQHLTNI